MGQLNTGDKAPTFTLLDQSGNKVSLKDFKGHRLLIYFYPKASTPGCTTQSCSVRDSLGDLQAQGAHAIGISPDQPDKQKKFDDKYELGFPLLSDPDHKVAEAYGVWGTKEMYGKEYQGIIRSSFLVDEKGKVLQVNYKISPKDTVTKALQGLSKE